MDAKTKKAIRAKLRQLADQQEARIIEAKKRGLQDHWKIEEARAASPEYLRKIAKKNKVSMDGPIVAGFGIADFCGCHLDHTANAWKTTCNGGKCPSSGVKQQAEAYLDSITHDDAYWR